MSIQTPSLISKAYYRLFSHDFTRFAAVGAIGFIVNYAMLTLLYSVLKLPILLSQLLSAEVALLCTFTGNNFWAFTGHKHLSIKKKLLKYHLTSGIGILISTGVVTGLVKYAHLYYGVALVIGSALALIWNYTVNRKFIFKHQADDDS
jgi:putative flippase GtrA